MGTARVFPYIIDIPKDSKHAGWSEPHISSVQALNATITVGGVSGMLGHSVRIIRSQLLSALISGQYNPKEQPSKDDADKRDKRDKRR